MTEPQPFWKTAGGKRRLLHEILPRLPDKIDLYVEPFVGGGAVFFALAAAGRIRKAVLTDVNAELINLYKVVRDKADELCDALAHGKGWENTKENYLAVRALDTAELDDVQRAARTLWLNRHCFNGLYRVNKKGEFNVPFGDYKNPRVDYDNLLACSEALRGAFIASATFDTPLHNMARQGSREGKVAVYCDPPYWPTKKTSFTSYDAGGFGPDDQKHLRAVLAYLPQDIHVLASNADVPEVHELYEGFLIEKVEAPRSINSDGAKRGAVGEMLISRRRS